MPMLSSSALRSLGKRTEEYHRQLHQPEGAALYAYLTAERGLSHETISRFRLGAVVDPDVSDEPAVGMVSIPYLRPVGVVGLRFRRPPERETGPKYWAPAGTKTGVFNTEPIITGGTWAVICEGEFDTMIAAQCGLPAVGIPGVANWKDHYPNLFDGFQRVLILADNDDNGQGQNFAESVAQHVPDPIVRLMPPGHDVNSYYLEVGREGLLSFLKIS